MPVSQGGIRIACRHCAVAVTEGSRPLAGPGVQLGAGQLGRNLAQGPRQVGAILARLQARLEEQRLAAQLQEERDAPVDVQVPARGPAARAPGVRVAAEGRACCACTASVRPAWGGVAGST